MEINGIHFIIGYFCGINNSFSVKKEYADKDERPKITKPQHVKYSGLLLHFPMVEVPTIETRALNK